MKVPVTLELLAELISNGYTVLHGNDVYTPAKWDWSDLMENDGYKHFDDEGVMLISELIEFWQPEDEGEFMIDSCLSSQSTQS